MANTLNDGQIILIQKQCITIDKNDIIVCNSNGESVVKRVVALGGDTIELKDGYVYRNNIKLFYTYEGQDKKYVLNNGQYFIIGDNYQNSYDSRNYGPVSSNTIIGKQLL